jgi:hypothetical protein
MTCNVETKLALNPQPTVDVILANLSPVARCNLNKVVDDRTNKMTTQSTNMLIAIPCSQSLDTALGMLAGSDGQLQEVLAEETRNIDKCIYPRGLLECVIARAAGSSGIYVLSKTMRFKKTHESITAMMEACIHPIIPNSIRERVEECDKLPQEYVHSTHVGTFFFTLIGAYDKPLIDKLADLKRKQFNLLYDTVLERVYPCPNSKDMLAQIRADLIDKFYIRAPIYETVYMRESKSGEIIATLERNAVMCTVGGPEYKAALKSIREHIPQSI